MIARATKPKPKRHRIVTAGMDDVGVVMDHIVCCIRERYGKEPSVRLLGETLFAAVRSPKHVIWIARVGKKGVGSLWVEDLQSLGPVARLLRVHHLYVRPQWRTHPRIGHDLYQLARKLSVRLGVPLAFEAPVKDRQWARRGFDAVSTVWMERRA